MTLLYELQSGLKILEHTVFTDYSNLFSLNPLRLKKSKFSRHFVLEETKLEIMFYKKTFIGDTTNTDPSVNLAILCNR